MFFRYPSMGTQNYRFRISDNSMSPREKFHCVFFISKNNTIMIYSQFISNGLVATPSICPDSFNQWFYFIIWNRHPFQDSLYSLCFSILNYKSVSKSWMFYSLFILPSRNSHNDYLFFLSTSSSFTRRTCTKERLVHFNKPCKFILRISICHSFPNFMCHSPNCFVVLYIQFPLHFSNGDTCFRRRHSKNQLKPFQYRCLCLVKNGPSCKRSLIATFQAFV